MSSDVLALRKTEILRSHRRHDALLRSLFSITVSTLHLHDIKQPQTLDLESFLEENNISNGRSFDSSSLPSTDSLLLPHVNAPRIESYQNHAEPKRVSDAAIEVQGELSRGGGDGTSGPKAQVGEQSPFSGHLRDHESSPWLTNGSASSEIPSQELSGAEGKDIHQTRKLLSSVDAVDSTTHRSLPQEPSLRPSEALPSTSEYANALVPSVLRELVAGKESGNARKLQLPPRELQEERLDHFDGRRDDGDDKGVSYTDKRFTNANGLTPPTSEEDIERRPGDKNAQLREKEPQPDGMLKSQVEIARGGALDETSSTPDEQLRLEEAQSMQPSKPGTVTIGGQNGDEKETRLMPPPASLSSGFIHDSMGDGEPILDISDMSNEVIARRGDNSTDLRSEQYDSPVRPTPGLRNHMYPGMNGDSSRDLTLSRRPNMRIDTGVPSISDSNFLGGNKTTGTPMPTPLETATPSKSAPAVASAQSPPERMTTRVSSGALRHKSVSEILGETPKITPTHADKGSFARELGDGHKEDHYSLQTPRSASSFTSPNSAAFKQRLSEIKEKERSKLSTVVFASSRKSDVIQAQRDDNESPVVDRDYLLTLFHAQVASPPRAQILNALVKTARKTLTTADHLTDFNERQACRVLSRIYELQVKNSWSLRQIERSTEPTRPVTQWDVLLSEVKWMRTDFREERKWKMAAAKYAAYSCQIWVAGTRKERLSLQVKIRSKPTRSKSVSIAASTPDLVHSGDEASEATDDESIRDSGSAPAAIFSLSADMFLFGLNKSPVAEKLLLELPLYQPGAEVQNAALHVTDIELDAAWKKPLVPVSKYAQGKIVSVSNDTQGKVVSHEEGPPRKRSRYNYYEADLRCPKPTILSDSDSEKILEPEQDDVALFDPEHKHIRDRIHTGHAFRPPSEHPMPSQSFFESRLSSQWTQAEDDELRRIVKDYSYNWSLISSSMTLPSRFSSSAERRTPWECFERWIGLEGLPVEMAKINYFKAYHQRLQAAQRAVEANYQALLQQHGSNAAQLPPRRRTTQPYSVERRKEQRHIHFIDAMRKNAKKRETALNKQQHVASLAAMRKANEAPKQRQQMHTPQEFSRLKYERQLKLEETARQYRASVIQHQKAAQAAKAGQQTNGMQPVRNPVPGVPNGTSPNMTGTNSHSQLRGGGGDSSRPVPPMQRLANGQTNSVLPTNSHGIPHAPMQPNVQMQMQMQQRMAPGMAPDNRVLQEASRLQAQQQAYQQQMRQQGHPQPNSHANSPNMQNPNHLSQNNAAMLASVQGRSSPSINGGPPPTGSSTSPRLTQPQALSSGMTPAVNQISSQFKARHPQASPEQITRMTTDQLYKMSNVSNEARHHAMQAAAGVNANAVSSNSNIGLQTPNQMQQAAMMANGAATFANSAQYAQLMRTQQASQQSRVNGGGGQSMNGSSRSVTPSMQRPGSAQEGPRPSQSPSARQVGLANGQ